MKRVLCTALLVAFAGQSWAQNAVPANDSVSMALEEVEVTGTRIERHIDVAELEPAVVLDRVALQEQTGLFLQESLNRVAGVRVENRTASGGQRITIRGYGNTERFNGYGYRAYLNGIPLTDAEGITILDDLDPSLLQSITVLKGPNSTRYGNGIAGAVLFETLRPQQKGSFVHQELTAGSFGLLRSNTRFEHRDAKHAMVLNYGVQQFDSYRVHSASNRDFVSLLGEVRLGEDESLSYYFGYHSTDEELAGQLDIDEFLARENVAESRYVANDASVQFEGFRSSLGYDRRLGRWDLSGRVFGTSNQQSQAFAVGLNRNSRTSFGGRATASWHSANDRWTAVMGSEVQTNSNLLGSYGYTGGVITGLRSDLEFSARNAMVFSEVLYHLNDKVRLSGGLSAAQISYVIDDRMRWDTTHLDGSGAMAFPGQFSPRLMAEWEWMKNQVLFAGWSQGFAAPTSAHVVIAEIGEVNSDLRPERGEQFELGLRGKLWGDRLSYALNGYRLRVSDKLTSEAITDAQGSVLYSRAFNAGAQNNLGLEASLDGLLYRSELGVLRELTASASYAFSHHRYDEFLSEMGTSVTGEDFSGNAVSGVPPHVFNAVITGQFFHGLFATAGYQYVDAMPINLANTAEAPSFSLVNAKMGYQKTWDHWTVSVFAGGQNLTESLHYQMVILNQAPRFGAAPKVFLPGPYTAQFFTGLSVRYRL